MSNQINEGAARYKTDNNSSHSREGGITEGNSNLPVPSDSQERQSCPSREGGNPLPIVEHLDLWTSTVTQKSTSGRGRGSGKSSKLELTGIKKLRELILELAVRGRLVPQNPDDEPASKLLEKIEAEKAQLIKDGKLKKQKPLAPVSEEEKPFELPEGWERIRLGNALEVINGRAYKKHEMLDSGTPLLRVGNLFTSNEWYYSDLELEPNKYIDNGDLIYAWSASFGPFIWDGGKVIYHYHIWKLEIFDQGSLYKPFAYNYLKAITEQIKASGSGIAMLHMTKERMEKLVIPLPPFAEQQRIVAKVDELMALCDQLEQQSEHQLTAHQQLTDTLLGTLLQPAAGALTESADATTKSSQKEQLNDNWQRLAQHFDLLLAGPMGAWAIDRLKDTVLQLAVMGKLVPQNPADEPASKLLERIEEEKARLVKEGKIKKPKKLPAVSDDEKPFELPEGWDWCHLVDISIEVGTGPFGSMINKAEYIDDGVPLINPSHMINDQIKEDRSISVSHSKAKELDSYILKEGDLVLARRGEVGRCALVTARENGWLCGTGSFYLRLSTPIFRSYMLLIFKVSSTRNYLTGNAVGTTMVNLNHTILNSLPIALPPEYEQQRIVTKVDELFALCGQLKERLQQASETEQHLTNAIVEQALG